MEDRIKTLEAQNATTETLLQQYGIKLAAAMAKADALSEQVAVLTEQVATLESAIKAKPGVSGVVGADKSEPLPEAKSFKIGGKSMRFKYAAFNLPSGKVLAHEAAADTKLREEIAKEYPGLIEPAE